MASQQAPSPKLSVLVVKVIPFPLRGAVRLTATATIEPVEKPRTTDYRTPMRAASDLFSKMLATQQIRDSLPFREN
jgi:hypothetical protein